MDKSKKIILFSTITVVGFFIGVMFHYLLGFYLKLSDPFNTFLYSPQIAFSDFTDTMWLIKDFAPFKATNYWLNYFPLAYILLFPFTFIKSKIVAYLIFAFAFAATFLCLNVKQFTCGNLTRVQNFQNIFIITFLSYPVICLLDRGNLDMLLFLLFAGFVYLFKSQKYLLSAVLIAIVNAIKPFSALFLILFLFKKKYKEFFISSILTLLLVFGGFLVLKGNFFDQISVFWSNLVQFKMNYVYLNQNDYGMINNSSLFMALKFLFCNYTAKPIISTYALATIYNYLSCIVMTVVILFAWREKIFWKQIAMLTLNMCLLPYAVYDYKLIFMFIPLWLFVNSKQETKFDLAYTILFGLLFVPKHVVIHWLSTGELVKVATLGILVNPLIIIIFMGLLIYEQILQRKKNINGY